MIPEVNAVRFEKVMGSGRTQPCLMVCEDSVGEEHEVVVKLGRHPQITPGGLAAEAISSLFAADLGLPTPEPYRVILTTEFAATVPDAALRSILEASAGVNFGSRKWGPGHTIWPREQAVPRAMRQAAMEIFAFDGLIQNPDRRAANPNCVFLGDDFLIYDHESAFSNFFTLFAKPPWEPGGLDFLKDHIFRSVLREETLSLDRLQGALEAIDEARFEDYVASIPPEWDGETLTREKAITFLKNCIPHFDRLRIQLQSVP